MKNLTDIESLVERFLNGETTLTEERTLERFFRTHRAELPTMPEPLRIVAAMFAEFQKERESQPAKPKPLMRRWAVAASVAVIFCLGVAAAGVWFAFSENSEHSEYSEVSETTAPKPDFLVFDNVEMEKVAATLGKHFRLKPVFQNEAIKKMRVYLKVDKRKTIDEVVELLNDLDEFTVSVNDGKLIIK